MEGHGTIMRKHHILTAVAAAAVFSLGASTLALAGEKSTSGGTFTYARSDSTTSFDLHQEITENNAFAIDKVFEGPDASIHGSILDEQTGELVGSDMENG